MTTPFRDELTAALERASELETENAELRARVAELEAGKETTDARLAETIGNSRGVMDRMKREHKDDEHTIEAVRAKYSETLRKLEALQAEPVQQKVSSLESSNARWAFLAAFAFVIGAATRFC